jgi:hypothetical protein
LTLARYIASNHLQLAQNTRQVIRIINRFSHEMLNGR